MNRVVLLATLESLNPGLVKGDTLEQGASYLLTGGAAWTFNDELAVCATLPKGSPLAEDVAVPAEPLLKLLRAATDEEVALEVEEGKLRVRGKRWRSTLKLEAIKHGPPKLPKAQWRPLPEEAATVLAATAVCASADASMPALCCVQVGNKAAIACDNVRIMQRRLPAGIQDSGWLLPAKVAVLLPAYQPTEYAVCEGWLRFKGGGMEMACRRPVEDYPPADKALANIEGISIPLPKTLPEALRRAGIFADAEFEQDRLVDVAVESGRLTVSGKGAAGRFEERMKCAAPDCTFSAHPSVLEEAAQMGEPLLVGKRAALITGKGYRYAIALAARE